jgi:hypothetical protein
MLETIEVNLRELRFDLRQQYYWSNAADFLRWCEWNLRPCVEKLAPNDHERFVSGSVPNRLLELARADLAERLLAGLSWTEHFEVVRKTLKAPDDYALWMNSPIGQLNKLPKGLRDAVAKAEKVRRKELHDAFFAEISDRQMTDYVQVSLSEDLAGSILISLARGELTLDDLDQKRNEQGSTRRTGGLRLLPLNDKRWVLRQVEIYGRLNQRGIPHDLLRFAEENDCSFFIELGKKLQRISDPSKRPPEVQWDKVNKVARFLVQHWCRWHPNSRLPPLCLFGNKALADFCTLALGRNSSANETKGTAVRKWVSRLRLLRARAPRIREIKLTSKEILFR